MQQKIKKLLLVCLLCLAILAAVIWALKLFNQ